jgi:hypothetical protein
VKELLRKGCRASCGSRVAIQARARIHERRMEKILFTINGLLGTSAYLALIQSSGSWVVPSHPV